MDTVVVVAAMTFAKRHAPLQIRTVTVTAERVVTGDMNHGIVAVLAFAMIGSLEKQID